MTKVTASRKTGRHRGYIASYRPQAKTHQLLEQAVAVLDEYRDYWPLTCRQIFYRMVGAHGYDKTEAAYGRLCHHLANARRGKYIPFHAIRDDGVSTMSLDHFGDHNDFLRHVRELGENYTRDKLAGQEVHLEIWCEASGMLPQLANVGDPFSVQAYSSGGFDSLTAKKNLANRICATEKPTVILHLGDYDPSGVSIFDSVAEDVAAFGREAELAIDARLISDTRRRHYTRMTVEEIRGLFDTIANLDHMGRFKQSLIEKGRKRELDRSAGIVRDAIEQNLGTGKVDKQSGFIRNTFNVAFTADTMLAAIDAQEFGPVYEEIKSSIDKGQVEEQRMGVELAEKLEDVFSVYSAKERAEMQKPRLVPGVSGYEWSKAEILSAALNTGNADNLDRLLDKNAAQPRRLTRPQLDALLDTLDKRDWDFVQSLWDTIDSYWPQLAEVEKRRTGVVPQKVEPVPVSTKFGTYRGGYYPISYDPTLSINAANDERTAWDRFTTAGHGAKAAVKNGMTISRVKNANGRTLKFDLGVPIRSMRDTIRLITLSEAIDNAHRILNHPQVAAAFFEAGRKNDLETLNLWLQDTARGPVFNTDTLNTAARMVKNNFTLSRLAFNLKTAALQFTGVSQSAVVIGKRNMARGFMDYLKRPRELTAEIIEKSPFMAERKSTFQRDIRDFLMDEQISSPLAGWWSNAKSNIGKAGFAPIVVTQFYAVDLPTWLGAYRSGLEQLGADEAKAIHYADRMVARAQGSGLIGDRSNIERGTLGTNTRQSDFVRLFTTLQSYMLVKMNRGYLVKDRFQREFRDAETLSGKMSAAATAATNLTLLYITEGALMGLLHMVLDGDDEAEWDDYLAFVGSEAFGSLLSGLPFGSNISAASRGFGGGGVLGSTLELPFQLYNQAAQGENDPAMRKAVGEAIGLATGLPSTATMRALETAMDDEKGLSDALFGHNPLTD